MLPHMQLNQMSVGESIGLNCWICGTNKRPVDSMGNDKSTKPGKQNSDQIRFKQRKRGTYCISMIMKMEVAVITATGIMFNLTATGM